MKRILKSRRGAAIEGVLFFMVVVFALSMLLLAAVTAMGYRNLATERTLNTRRDIEQIGMYFVAGEKETQAFKDYVTDKGYTEESGRLSISADTLILKNKNEKTVLYVVRDGNGKATRWYYGDPPQQQ